MAIHVVSKVPRPHGGRSTGELKISWCLASGFSDPVSGTGKNGVELLIISRAGSESVTI